LAKVKFSPQSVIGTTTQVTSGFLCNLGNKYNWAYSRIHHTAGSCCQNKAITANNK